MASIAQGIGILLSAGSLIVRFRRARGEEQQQLKWIAYGAAVWSLAIALTLTRQWNAVTQIVALVALNGFIAALGLAMLKYRLYAIDLIINRTLVYGALALIITAVYVGLVAGVGQFVGTRGEPNLALSLLTTGVVAVAFQPLRERVHRMANRLVYGHRTSPYEVLAEFSRRISGALSADEVLPSMALAAARAAGSHWSPPDTRWRMARLRGGRHGAGLRNGRRCAEGHRAPGDVRSTCGYWWHLDSALDARSRHHRHRARGGAAPYGSLSARDVPGPFPGKVATGDDTH